MLDHQQRTYLTRTLPVAECSACGKLTPWRCLDCLIPVCASCEVSMYAMCQACRQAYIGPINVLGKRADTYIAAEFARMFV